MNVYIHFFFTLFFKIALAGSQPDKNYFVMTSEILIHKMCQDDRFATSGAAF
ncbi:hypothetical protein SDC9_201333 [bioreactor metagenome]|uniref:Uncharacterized protein n=1 Tax=bioreactor metagenome TaxID=1076179 RepID=A0A645ITD7_9ZZZZ